MKFGAKIQGWKIKIDWSKEKIDVKTTAVGIFVIVFCLYLSL